MKILLGLGLLLSLASCGHTQKSKDTYRPVISFSEDGKKFEATVQLPQGFKTKIPLVVIVHEWWGRNSYVMNRSKMLNQEGFATLVVDLYGDNQVVETPAEAQALATPFYQNAQLGISRLDKFVAMAKNDPHIDAAKIFVIGYCFGGTQALNLARSGSDVRGVVSFHGGLSSSLPQKAIKAQVLAINGLADPMVPAKDRSAFEKEMKTIKAEYKIINYKGATHAFSNPMATDIGKKYNIPVGYNKAADEGSWKDLMEFLKE